jgi:hypothetical protein
MEGDARLAVFILVSLAVFVFVLRLVLRRRAMESWLGIIMIALIVVPGGMLFARWGVAAGLAWWVFYTVPALVTLLVPPFAFRMARSEAVEYLVLALLMAPVIHTVFSLFLGWKEYMPFLPVPFLFDLLGWNS